MILAKIRIDRSSFLKIADRLEDLNQTGGINLNSRPSSVSRSHPAWLRTDYAPEFGHIDYDCSFLHITSYSGEIDKIFLGFQFALL